MRKYFAVLLAVLAAFAGGLFVPTTTLSLHGQAQPGTGFAAVSGEKGGWDITGPYDVVRDWPKPLSQLPGHENWTWGAGEAIFAESADRVFFSQMGELPEGNLYVAEVGNGRLQKFTPRRGARPELLVGKPPVPRS